MPDNQPTSSADANGAPQWEPLDEDAVQAVAHAMAQAHHGADVLDANGYMQDARSFVAAQRALAGYKAPKKFDHVVADPRMTTPLAKLPPEPPVQSLPLKLEPTHA